MRTGRFATFPSRIELVPVPVRCPEMQGRRTWSRGGFPGEAPEGTYGQRPSSFRQVCTRTIALSYAISDDTVENTTREHHYSEGRDHMRNLRLIAVAAAAALSLAAGLAAAAPAANAAVGSAASPVAAAVNAHGCPAGDLCVYDGLNYTGSFYGIFGYSTNDTGIYDFTHAESVFNNGTSCTAIYWTGTDFTGTPRALARGTGLASLQYTDAWHHIYSNSWSQCV